MNPHTYDDLIFDKEAKTIQWEKKTAFSTNCAGSTVSQCVEECKLIHSYLIVQSKDLHIKPDTLNLIEEKVEKNLKYISMGENFLNKTPMTHALISTIDKWNLMKLKSFCKSKDTV